MIDRNTIDQLSALKIEELADIIKRQNSMPEYISMPFDQRFQFAISDLYSMKMDTSFKRLVSNAKFKYSGASFNAIEYIPERNLDRNVLLQLSTGNFATYGTDVALFGATGSGKTYIACCLGIVACRHGLKARFYRLSDLIADYECIETAKQRKRFITRLANFDILVLDEWLDKRLDDEQMEMIFDVIEKRKEAHSTVYCTQYAPADWYLKLGETTRSESILNRIFCGLCKFNCGTFNMREYYSALRMRI